MGTDFGRLRRLAPDRTESRRNAFRNLWFKRRYRAGGCFTLQYDAALTVPFDPAHSRKELPR